MIDPANKQTRAMPIDQPKRRPGRPISGKAPMTPAEKQKAYRERKNQENQDTIARFRYEDIKRELEITREVLSENCEMLKVAYQQIEELKAQVEKPKRMKRHRDQPAIEITDLKIED